MLHCRIVLCKCRSNTWPQLTGRAEFSGPWHWCWIVGIVCAVDSAWAISSMSCSCWYRPIPSNAELSLSVLATSPVCVNIGYDSTDHRSTVDTIADKTWINSLHPDDCIIVLTADNFLVCARQCSIYIDRMNRSVNAIVALSLLTAANRLLELFTGIMSVTVQNCK